MNKCLNIFGNIQNLKFYKQKFNISVSVYLMEEIEW